MTSMTNGWNAVCALENSEVNELLLRQFLNNGAGSPGTPLTFGMTIGSSSGNQLPSGAWLGSVTLNPPLVSLSEMAGSQSGQISMTTSDAVVVMNQLDGVFTAAAMSIPPSSAPIQRTVQLQQVAGTVGGATVGEVALTFPGQPQTQNPGSVYDLMANVVAATPLTYNLGKILNTNSGPGLEPASFELAIQSSSDGTSTALLMLITTSGQPGTSPSLLQYPLSEGVTAALIISEDLFWSEVFPPALTTAFNQGAKAAYYVPFKPIVFTPFQAGDGSWSISVTSGIANIGGLAIPRYLNVTCGGKILLLIHGRRCRCL